MKVLVTGGAGFIGSALIRQLISDQSYLIFNIDKLTYSGCENSLSGFNESPRYFFEQADICDRAAINRIFFEFEPDAVVHLAAESHVDRSIDGPEECLQTNIMGTFVLLEEALAYQRKTGRLHCFHHVSTDEVFGDLHPDDPPFGERSPYQPSSPYAASKACSDHLVRAWGRTYGLRFVISNCSNNYGPNQYPEKLIPLTILRALEGLSLPVYGDGQQIRDWLFVEDHVKALQCIFTQGEIGKTYLVGGRSEQTNLEVVEMVCRILQQYRPIDGGYSRLIRFVEDRPGHDRRYAIDPETLERELGWKATESFASGMDKTVRWYLDNSDWLKNREVGAIRRGLGVEPS